jgi:hypothetical protein
VVVGYNLCPFARRELEAGKVCFAVSEARDEEQLLLALAAELEHLNADPDIETTLLIHPYVLTDFMDFNQFLATCDALLGQLALTGIYQIASFHPDYRFAGTQPQDAENYSNRAPYPMLHVLREDSVARAVDGHPNAEGIPDRNIALLNRLGSEHLGQVLLDCFEENRE